MCPGTGDITVEWIMSPKYENNINIGSFCCKTLCITAKLGDLIRILVPVCVSCDLMMVKLCVLLWADDYHYSRMWNVPEARGISRLSKLSLSSSDCDKNNVRFLRFFIINSLGKYRYYIV